MAESPYALLDRVGAASIFFPRDDQRPPPPGSRDLSIEVDAGIEVAARFYAQDPANPTILYFHGNGEVAADHDDIAPFYHAIGLNLFVAEFRGYGRSNGQPSYEALVEDAHPVVEFFHTALDQEGFDARRYIMGRSLGSQPALEVASRAADRFQGLIIESGAGLIGRMLQRLGLELSGEAAALAEHHESKIRAIRLPALLIHGERDDLVPIRAAIELDELLAETERELVVIPDAGHNDLLWRGQTRYFEAIAKFVAGTAAV